jgi:hypothetical protein
LIIQWIGMVEYILCYGDPAVHRGPLPATRLASRKTLIEQNIKKRTGSELCVFCGENTPTGLWCTAVINCEVLVVLVHRMRDPPPERRNEESGNGDVENKLERGRAKVKGYGEMGEGEMGIVERKGRGRR